MIHGKYDRYAILLYFAVCREDQRQRATFRFLSNLVSADDGYGLLLEREEYDECELSKDDNGDSIPELLVQGLVVPCLHAEPCADATAYHSHKQQSGLWYSPL